MKRVLSVLSLAVALAALFTACNVVSVGVKTSPPSPVSEPGSSVTVSTSGEESRSFTETVTTETASSETETLSATTETPTQTTPESPTEPSTETPTESENSSVLDETKTRPEDFQPFYPTDKVVAFTFDDGPCWVTPQILDVLEGTDDHVTFFMVGEMIDKNPTAYASYVKRAYDMGCEIGSHTENHTSLYKNKADVDEAIIAEQLDKVQARFEAITGDRMHIMRPPGGALNRERKYGYAAFIWSLDSEDWRIYGEINKAHEYVLGSTKPERQAYKEEVAKLVEDATVENVLKQVQSGDIVLMHDIYFTSARAFKRIYATLKEQGYRFVTVSELLNIDPVEYDGWYFFSTRAAGHDGATAYAKKPASAPAVVRALPPEKFGEE